MKRSNETLENTKCLYFENSYQSEFEAQIIKNTTYKQNPALILDQSCFYPESGGQPSDEGWINEIKVIKVFEEEGIVFHLLEKDIPSGKVTGKIDWEIRFDHMQQHSGQHILSQSFYELLEAQTLSFHLGERFSNVEIDLRKTSEEEVEKVERRANEIVFQDIEIKSYFVPDDKIDTIPLRKAPQKKGSIRVVEISEFGYSACGGTHVRRTGEVGLVKILRSEKIRNNIRFEFVCGKRALENYIWKNKVLHELSNRFTVHEKEVSSSVEKLFSDLKSQKKRNRRLQEKISQYEAQEIVQKAEERVIKQIFTGRSPEEVRALALNIIRKGDYIVLFGLRGEERGHLVLACSDNYKIDMRECLPLVSPLIEGRGGGSPSLVEIAGKAGENLEAALDRVCEYLKRDTSS